LKLVCALILRGFPLGEHEQTALRAEIIQRQAHLAA
jgi:hypothetical protein